MPSQQIEVTPLPESSEVTPDVFVSPRVLDRRLYDELASALRELIGKARTEQRQLASAQEASEKTAERLERASEEIRTRLKAAAQVLSSIDERLTRADTLAKAAEQRVALTGGLAKRVDAQMQTRLAELEGRVDELLTRLDASADAADGAVERVRGFTTDIQERFEQQTDAVLRQVEHAARVGVDGRVDEAAKGLINEAEVKLISARKSAEALRGGVLERLETACAKAESLCDRAEDAGLAMALIRDDTERANSKLTELQTKAKEQIEAMIEAHVRAALKHERTNTKTTRKSP